jgi:CheY-like chemotaxis protein
MAINGMQNATQVLVLIVDDDASLRRMVGMVLKDAEWDFLEAKNGIEALAALRSCTSHLIVLLDWKMPEMSGEEVLEVVATDPDLTARHAYVLITANAAALNGHLEDLLTRLQVPMLAKPFSIRELMQTVDLQAHRLDQTKVASESQEIR